MFFRRPLNSRLALALVLGAGAASAWAQSAQRVQAIELVKQASTAFGTGDMLKVITLCRRALQADPAYPRAYTWLGAAYQRRGDRTTACSAFSRVVRLAPNTPDSQRAARGLRELGCAMPTIPAPNPTSPLAGTTAHLERRWAEPAGQGVTGLAFSPDGQFVTSGNTSGDWRLWRASDGTLDQLKTGSDGEAGGVAASSDFYAVGSGSGTIRLFDARDGRKAGEIESHFGPVYTLAYSGDGRTLAAAGPDRSLKLFDARQNTLNYQIQDPKLVVLSAAFSPDSRLVAASVGAEVRIYDVSSGRLLRSLRGDGLAMGALAWSRGGTLLAGATQNRIRIWNSANGQLLRVLNGHRLSVTSLAFGNGSLLASGGYDNELRLWDAATGSSLANLPFHTSYVRAVAFDATGKRLVSGDASGQIGLWRLP